MWNDLKWSPYARIILIVIAYYVYLAPDVSIGDMLSDFPVFILLVLIAWLVSGWLLAAIIFVVGIPLALLTGQGKELFGTAKSNTSNELSETDSIPSVSQESASSGSVIAAIFSFIFFTFLCGWIPLVGTFFAGFLGGRAAGTVSKAVIAVTLPGIVIGAILFSVAEALVDIPFIGILAGAGGFVLMLGGVGPLFLGAIVGALLTTD